MSQAGEKSTTIKARTREEAREYFEELSDDLRRGIWGLRGICQTLEVDALNKDMDEDTLSSQVVADLRSASVALTDYLGERVEAMDLLVKKEYLATPVR